MQTPEGNGIWAAESTEQVEGALCRRSGGLGFLWGFFVAFRMGRGSFCVFSLSKKEKKKNITSEKFWKMYGKESRTNLAARGRRAPLLALFAGSSACAPLAQKPACFHPVSSLEVPCKHVSVGLLIISVNHSRIRLPPWGQCPGSPASFTSAPPLSVPFPPTHDGPVMTRVGGPG